MSGTVEVYCPRHPDVLVARWQTGPNQDDVIMLTFPGLDQLRAQPVNPPGAGSRLAWQSTVELNVEEGTRSPEYVTYPVTDPRADRPHTEYKFICSVPDCPYLLLVRDDTIDRVVKPIAQSVHANGGTFKVPDFDALLRRVARGGDA